jgi:hypothetical protein
MLGVEDAASWSKRLSMSIVSSVHFYNLSKLFVVRTSGESQAVFYSD